MSAQERPEVEPARASDAAGAADIAPRATDVAGLPDLALRQALEFAIGIAAAGQKLRPPLQFPPALKTYLRFTRLDRTSLRAVRKIVAADEGFRDRIAGVATPDLVDELGAIWLQRPEGWEQRVLVLHAEAKAAAEAADAEVVLRRSERRREAAEQAAARAAADLLAQHESVAREQMRREKADERAAVAEAAVRSLRTELEQARRESEKLRAKLGAETARADRAEAHARETTIKLRDAEQMRDQALALRVEATPAPASEPAVAAAVAGNARAASALQNAALATRELAKALAAAGEALNEPAVMPNVVNRKPRERASQRQPIAIPGGVYGNSAAAAEHLLRTENVNVVVDGYNVAKLAWPHLELADQRECCIELLEDVVRRFGTDIHVVFDGASVIGTSARRRLVRVSFSPAGVSADDVIRREVAALPVQVPVVVVTNDQAIVNDVRTMGANPVASDMLLTAAGRSLPR